MAFDLMPLILQQMKSRQINRLNKEVALKNGWKILRATLEVSVT